MALKITKTEHGGAKRCTRETKQEAKFGSKKLRRLHDRLACEGDQ